MARVACTAAILLPLRLIQVPVRARSNGRYMSLAKDIIAHSLKWRSKDADAVALLHTEMAQLCYIHAKACGTLAYSSGCPWLR
jgi:hypothetical protein